MGEYLYVAVNDSIPELIKVGFTTRPPTERLLELYSTGVPMPFRFILVLSVHDGADSERLVHDALHPFRVNKNREFFKAKPEKAIPILLRALDFYEVDWDHTPPRQGIPDIDILTEANIRKENEKRRWQLELKKKEEDAKRAFQLAEHAEKLSQIDASLEMLARKRKMLGAQPNPVRGGCLSALLIFVWLPVGPGLALWCSVYIWIVKGKSEDAGAVCLCVLVAAFTAWFILEKKEEKREKLMIPFAQIDREIEKVSAARAILLKEEAAKKPREARVRR